MYVCSLGRFKDLIAERASGKKTFGLRSEMQLADDCLQLHLWVIVPNEDKFILRHLTFKPGISCKKNPSLIDLGKVFIFGKIIRIGRVIPKEAKPLGKLSKHSISSKSHAGYISEESRSPI